MEEFKVDDSKLYKAPNLTAIEYSTIMSNVSPYINETKTKDFIREVNVNTLFYSNLKKEMLLEDISSIAAMLGGFKDFLTANSLIKTFVEKIRKWSEKSIKGKTVDKFWDSILKTLKWVKSKIGVDGIAWIMAAVKFRTLKPSKEQVDSLKRDASKVWIGILTILLMSYSYKLVYMFQDIGVDHIINFAKQDISSLGVPSMTAFFSAFSSYKKSKDIKKLLGDINALKEKEQESLEKLDIKYSNPKKSVATNIGGSLRSKRSAKGGGGFGGQFGAGGRASGGSRKKSKFGIFREEELSENTFYSLYDKLTLETISILSESQLDQLKATFIGEGDLDKPIKIGGEKEKGKKMSEDGGGFVKGQINT